MVVDSFNLEINSPRKTEATIISDEGRKLLAILS